MEKETNAENLPKEDPILDYAINYAINYAVNGTYAPVNCMPQYPPPTPCGGILGDLTF